jgi:hypothetical protein
VSKLSTILVYKKKICDGNFISKIKLNTTEHINTNVKLLDERLSGHHSYSNMAVKRKALLLLRFEHWSPSLG